MAIFCIYRRWGHGYMTTGLGMAPAEMKMNAENVWEKNHNSGHHYRVCEP